MQLPESQLWSYVIPPEGEFDHSAILRSLADLKSIVTVFEECPQWLPNALGAFVAPPVSLVVLPGQKGASPLHGLISTYPIYAALASPYFADHRADAELAKAALLVALVQGKEVAQTASQTSIREIAGRAVRQICLRPAVFELAKTPLGLGTSSIRGLAEHFKEHLNAPGKPSKDSGPALLESFARLIDYACDIRIPPQRSGGSRATGARWTASNEEDAQEPDARGSSRGFQTPPIAESARAARVQRGAAPIREGVGELDFEIRGLAEPPSSNPRMTALKARTRARAIAASAQPLAHASDRLQLLDLSALIRWCLRDFGLGRKAQGWRAVADLLMSSLLTGRAFEEVLETRCLQRPPGVDAPVSKLSVLSSPFSWLLPGPLLADGFQPAGSEQELYRPVARHLILPVPLALAGLRDRLSRRDGESVFGDVSPKIWRQWASKALNKINRKSGARLTLLRISSFLSEFVVFMTGDAADGAFFANRPDKTACAARLYYYAPWAQDVTDRYREAWDSVAHALGGLLPLDLEWSWTRLPEEYRTRALGSAGCPLAQVVSNQISSLRERAFAVIRRPGRPTSSQFEKRHNAMTAYTVGLAMWAGALRAVTDPLVLDLIEPEQGYLGVSEKDSDDYALSRVIWLPALALQQFRHYAEHRDVQYARRRKFKVKAYFSPGWCYFLDNGTPSPVTPSRLEREFGPEYLLRLNAQRHYLRTILREKGVSGAAVDALLGHAAFGEEPYSRFSAFSPRMMRDELQGVLPDLLIEMGWRVTPGLQG